MLPNELETLFRRYLTLPRSTHYQQLCERIGRLMLRLPIEPWPIYGQRRYSGDPYSTILEDWILTVLAENKLAGILLLDAVDYLTSALDHLVCQAGSFEFPLTQHKKRFTQAMQGVLVAFEVPPGWELIFGGKKRSSGFRGIAAIRRCHLSDDFGHRNDAISQLAGVPWNYETDVGYFDIRCHLDPNRAIVDGRLRKRKRDRPVIDITIPYTFISHVIDWPTFDTMQLIARPTDDDVLSIAERAID